MALTIPSTAPFSGAQKMWLEGDLAALDSAPAPAVMAVTILWGSPTGNSQALGKKLSKSLTAMG